MTVGTPCLVAFCFAVLHGYCTQYKRKVCSKYTLTAPRWASLRAVFPAALAHFVSLLHFRSSCNTSPFIIVIFVTVTCDQWPVISDQVTCNQWPVISGLWSVICDQWPVISDQVTCNQWPVTSDLWSVACDQWPVISDQWPVISDLWSVTCDQWPVISDLWSVTCDPWSVACDQWSVISDLWPVTCDLCYFYDSLKAQMVTGFSQ